MYANCSRECMLSEGRRNLMEMNVQKTVSLTMRDSDQFASADGCCKQSHSKCNSSTVKPMDLHTILLSSPYSHVVAWIHLNQ